MRSSSLLVAFLVWFVTPLAHAALTSAATRPGLLINDRSSGVTATAGGLGFSDAGFGFAARSVELTAGVPAMPALNLPPTRTVESVQSAASTWVALNQANFRSELAAFMRRYGFSSAWYAYERLVEVSAAGGMSTQKLTWSLYQDNAGRASFGEPRLAPADDADARILHVRYWVQHLPLGLTAPPGYNGGYLQWQLLDPGLTPVAGSGTSGSQAVNGAFDPPNASQDSLEGLSCLLNKGRPGCPAAPVDIKSLLAATGAQLAVVDYTYGIEPRYEIKADAFCPDGASTCYVPVATYRFTERELTYENCGDTATYRNRGTYAFELTQVTDRFVVDLTLKPNLLQRNEESLAPIQYAFNESMPLTAEQVSLLQPATTPTVIDPFDHDSLISAHMLSGTLAQLAPIETGGERTCPPLTVTLNSGSMDLTAGAFLMMGFVSGGLPDYDYHWHKEGAYAGSILLSSANNKSTYVSFSGPRPKMVPPLQPMKVGRVVLTVTDARGTQAAKAADVFVLPEPACDPTQYLAPVIEQGGTRRSNRPPQGYTVSWSRMGCAPLTHYELFENNSLVYQGLDTSKFFSTDFSGEWHYKVRACNGVQCGPFSHEIIWVVCIGSCL